MSNNGELDEELDEDWIFKAYIDYQDVWELDVEDLCVSFPVEYLEEMCIYCKGVCIELDDYSHGDEHWYQCLICGNYYMESGIAW